MWKKLIISQVFGIAAAYVSGVAWASLFGTAPPFVVQLGAWLVTSLYTIAKL